MLRCWREVQGGSVAAPGVVGEQEGVPEEAEAGAAIATATAAKAARAQATTAACCGGNTLGRAANKTRRPALRCARERGQRQ